MTTVVLILGIGFVLFIVFCLFVSVGVDFKGIDKLRHCRCPNCQAKFTEKFIFAAEKEARERFKNLTMPKLGSNVMVVIPPEWFCVCPQCHQQLIFHASRGTIRVREESPSNSDSLDDINVSP